MNDNEFTRYPTHSLQSAIFSVSFISKDASPCLPSDLTRLHQAFCLNPLCDFLDKDQGQDGYLPNQTI